MEMIKKALELAGYDDAPTEENLVSCFLDYVDAGVWGNLDYEDAKEDIESGDITVYDMCKAIIKYCRG